MSSPPAVNTPSASAEDTLIPLMLAACPGMKLDYKRMSAIDGVKSASSFEHRFRKYRVRAQEILAACGGDAVAGTVPEGLAPVTPKKRVTKDVGEGGAGDDGEETPKKKGRTPKKPKAPKSPKAPTTPKTPKKPKAGKGGKGKVGNGENDEDEEGNDDDALQAAHDEGMEDYGYQVKEEMSFEFEGSEL
ncbi:MAG: hypothetical protein M1830_006312 [Pleopsidium flavum]|nr:MAG: hypothetical protein M1830_006312 [Pleopsidium flavum]